jgi:uncharacterized phage-associated protein
MAYVPDKQFDLEKAIQAVGVVLRHEGLTSDRVRLLKLLYIADRRSLEKFGRPIIGSKMVALPYGPLHSHILDLIHDKHVGTSRWASFFRNHGVRVELVQQPDVGLLSKQEIDLLAEVAIEFAETDDWDLVHKVTHKFVEYGRNIGARIPIGDILDAVGRGADTNQIAQDVTDSEAFNRFFAELEQ